MEQGVSVERAVALIRSHVSPVGVERIPASQAVGRVVADDIISPINQPPWPRSPLDGYAFRASDSFSAAKDNPVSLRVIDTFFAGGWSEKVVQKGEAVRLMTGAPIPAGCDCVIRQENTDYGMDTVQIYQELNCHDNYCDPGEDFRSGDVIIPSGTRLSGNALGVLASAGLFRDDVMLSVYKKVRCALICTGDELVSNAVRPLPPGKIYSSNEAVLVSRFQDLGVIVSSVNGGFHDDPAALADAIREALSDADAVITTGGVSVGTKDILHDTLPLLQADRIFWQARLKPGTPLMFSLVEGKPILSLSGNPFAASATFELFARPMLAGLCGCDDLIPTVVLAQLGTQFPKFGRGRRFVRGTLREGIVSLPSDHSSGQLRSSVGTNCLAEIPPSDVPLPEGTSVRVWIL